MRNIIAKVIGLGVLAAPLGAGACPSCPTALAARAALFDERFAAHSVMVLLPLVLLGALAALAYRVGLPEGAPKTEEGKDA